MGICERKCSLLVFSEAVFVPSLSLGESYVFCRSDRCNHQRQGTETCSRESLLIAHGTHRMESSTRPRFDERFRTTSGLITRHRVCLFDHGPSHHFDRTTVKFSEKWKNRLFRTLKFLVKALDPPPNVGTHTCSWSFLWVEISARGIVIEMRAEAPSFALEVLFSIIYSWERGEKEKKKNALRFWLERVRQRQQRPTSVLVAHRHAIPSEISLLPHLLTENSRRVCIFYTTYYLSESSRTATTTARGSRGFTSNGNGPGKAIPGHVVILMSSVGLFPPRYR